CSNSVGSGTVPVGGLVTRTPLDGVKNVQPPAAESLATRGPAGRSQYQMLRKLSARYAITTWYARHAAVCGLRANTPHASPSPPRLTAVTASAANAAITRFGS